jgi:hypothetical protein
MGPYKGLQNASNCPWVSWLLDDSVQSITHN